MIPKESLQHSSQQLRLPSPRLTGREEYATIVVLQLLVHDIDNIGVGLYDQHRNASAFDFEGFPCVLDGRKDTRIQELTERGTLIPVVLVMKPAILEADDQVAVLTRTLPLRISQADDIADKLSFCARSAVFEFQLEFQTAAFFGV